MDKGEYVPDEVTNLMVRNRIDAQDAEPGCLVAGDPLTLAHVEVADGMTRAPGQLLDAEQTEPLIGVYRHRAILVEVDGMGEIDEVTSRIFDALDVVPQS